MESGKDKRKFKRYPKESDADLKVGGTKYKARTFDYSFSGLGAVLEDSPPIKVGDDVNIEISDPLIKGNGKIVWARKREGNTLIGVSRRGVISGSLNDFSLADIMIGIQRSGRTGMLHVTKTPLQKSVYIENGDMIFARSNEASDMLGNIMLREGMITYEQFDHSSEVMKKTGKRHGTVLVELGYIKADDLVWAVKLYVENVIASLFKLWDGEFMFKEGALPTEEFIKLKLSVANLIYRGIRSIDDPGFVRRQCPPIDAALFFSPDPLDLFQSLDLDETDRELMRLVDGKRTVKDILDSVSMNDFEAMRSIFALLSTRIVEVLERPEQGAEIPEGIYPEQAQDEDVKQVVGEINDLYQRHENLGYYGVLGVNQESGRNDIKRAYYKKAKRFHPDKHYNLPEDMKDKLNTVFTYITSAYSTLVSSELRRQYDSMPKDNAGVSKLSNSEIAEQKFKEGIAAMKGADFPEAAKHFAAAAYLDNATPKFHYFAGLALARNGQNKDAERAINRALKSEPFNPLYLAEAGHIYLALGLQLRARGSFKKALKFQPDNKRAQEGLQMLPAVE